MNEVLDALPCGSGCGSFVYDCLSDDRASEWRRNEMKEVLPLFLAPMTRTLEDHVSCAQETAL